MRVTIDSVGRIVVPKALRDQLCIAPGAELDARVEGGALIARPLGPEVLLVEENGRLVTTTTAPVEPMSRDELQHRIDESRDWPRNG